MAAVSGHLALAIVAADASRNSTQKVVPLLTARSVALMVGPDALALGAAVGRSAVAVLGVLDNQLAAGISRAIETGTEKSQAE
jgi:ribosomal protein L7Ae-like RNA K-turn-binding protein